MPSDYVPIACALHDRLEDLAVRRRAVPIRWTEEDGTSHETVDRVADIRVREGQEFLVLGGGGIVRLDRLLEVDGVAFGGSC